MDCYECWLASKAFSKCPKHGITRLPIVTGTIFLLPMENNVQDWSCDYCCSSASDSIVCPDEGMMNVCPNHWEELIEYV